MESPETMLREKAAEIAALRRELSEYKSVRGRLDRGKLESVVETLRRENRGLRDILREHGIHRTSKTVNREDGLEL